MRGPCRDEGGQRQSAGQAPTSDSRARPGKMFPGRGHKLDEGPGRGRAERPKGPGVETGKVGTGRGRYDNQTSGPGFRSDTGVVMLHDYFLGLS